MSINPSVVTRDLVVGTAGHIDHGKTSLIRALTGTDTDRLLEEKRRGISIDLGFAHLQLSRNRRISLIDVPGHERFVKNMLAGTGGIQAVLLVVAANESVKPQTREHFHICRLLGIRKGVVALTKIDMADAEQRDRAISDIRLLCEGSFLEDAPLIPVSTVNCEGLPELKVALSQLVGPVQKRDGVGLARLPVDRSFALRGFGTVVTGTLSGGRLSIGDIGELRPSKRQVRIRGLQVHGKNVEEALAGQRTAVNLSGIEHREIRRGDVLAHAGELEDTSILDVSLDWLSGMEPAKKREEVLLHLGTSEIMAALKVFRTAQAEQGSLARLVLHQPITALPGDRFILRRPSPPYTVAGGSVIDAFPITRINRAKTIVRLDVLAKADLRQRVQILVNESKEGRFLRDLVPVAGAITAELRSVIQEDSELLLFEQDKRVLTKAWLQDRRTKLFTWLAAFHAKNPSAKGAPMAAARLGLTPDVAAIVFHQFPAVRVEGETVALATHRAQLNPQQIQVLAKIEDAFRQGGFQPPPPKDVLGEPSIESAQNRALLESLVKSKRLIRIADNVIFHSDVIAHIRRSLATHRGRRFSIHEFKEWMNISRKYAIPLLEHLDREHVTRRDGDRRVVL